ncbi:uncharacterized protein LOC105701946 [Orussus abietinus]|uniref:uncharacterized protein LOC105701946 n=1 Tax=Orussus abietinus TaxID=222816 RepID=UPI000625891A|nr:uncharacterized protein LOC105701946 [Orussus abietinus]
MFQRALRPVSRTGKKFFIRANSTSNKDKFFEKDIAFESEYYYKQDQELLKMVKQKTQEEVTKMQNEIRAMRDKIEDTTKSINESLRFLKGLESDLPASNKKKF